ncbi:NACHT domain-containing NTPase [Aquiflexum sp.]|uniref:NACHT domain-containing protein n=1 Tax=Aquiflexum sp. TaxID=1872584 RepID=UPI0035946AF5
MPYAGGPANIAGVEYEQWFVALKFAESFFNPNIEVSAQARYIPSEEPGKEETIASIDDVVVFNCNQPTFFTIKKNAPKDAWTITSLISQGVLPALVAQFRKTPDSSLVLVSESNSRLIREDFLRIRKCNSEIEIKSELGGRFKEWEKLIEYTGLEISQLIKFCKNCEIKVMTLDNIKEQIVVRFEGKVSHSKFVPELLFNFTFEKAIRSLRTKNKDITDYLADREVRSLAPLDITELEEMLIQGSTSLANNPVGLSFKNDCFIERKETIEIINWINRKEDVENDNSILILVGDAGTGKTTVLKHLYENLIIQGTPILGIKADCTTFITYELFKNELNLKEDLDRIFVSIIEKHEKVVLVVDQIDALSLSLSKDRTQINKYSDLIYKLSKIKGVSVIISCRTYDLNNDPRLIQYKNAKQIEIGIFTEKEISEILEQKGLQTGNLNINLINLLKTPLHLEIFTRLELEHIQLGELETLQSLYYHLWNQKILNFTYLDPKILTEFLAVLVTDLFQNQSMSAFTMEYDMYSNEMGFLLSENLLRSTGPNGKFSFFHQTFFDYTLARTFVSSRRSISNEIKNIHQGLFLRNKVRTVISFLRGSKRVDYNKEIQKILTSPEFRFHIKTLIIGDLCSQRNPSKEEKNLVKELLANPELYQIVVESITSAEIFRYVSSIFISKLLQNPETNLSIAWTVCSKILQEDEIPIYDFLKNLPEFEIRDRFISEVLFQVKLFENESFKEFFKLVEEFLILDNEGFLYYHILENAALKHIDWVLDQLFLDLKNRLNKVKNARHYQFELLVHRTPFIYKKVYSISPEKTYQFLIKSVHYILEKTKIEYESCMILKDQVFYDFNLKSKIDHDYHFVIVTLIKEHIISQIDQNSDFAYEELSQFKKSKFSTFNYIYFIVMLERPDFDLEGIFDFVLSWLIRFRIDGENRFTDGISIFLRNCFSQLSLNQKNQFIDFLKNQRDPVRFYEEIKLNPYFGRTSYILLKHISDLDLENEKWLRSYKQELLRKFEPIEEKARKYDQTFFRENVPQLSPSSFSKISFENWLNYFGKYPNSEELYNRHFTIAYNLEKEININNIEWYLKLIPRFVSSTTIPQIYSARIINGLMIAGANSQEVIQYYEQLLDGKKVTSKGTLDLLHPIDHFIKEKTFSEKIFDWFLLCFEKGEQGSANHKWIQENKENADSSFQLGYNSVSGFAVFKLISYVDSYEYFLKLVSTIENKISELDEVVISMILNKLAWLNIFDKERCLNLFINLTRGGSRQVLNAGYISSQYMNNVNFDKMTNYYYDVINKVTDDQRIFFFGQVLTVAAINNYQNAQELLEKAFEKNDKYKAGSIETIVEYIVEGRSSEYINKLWNRFLNEEGRDISNAFSKFFFKCPTEKFDEFYYYIQSYTSSRIGRGRDYEYYKFLMAFSADHPDQCIDLILNSPQPIIDIQYSGLIGEEQLQIIISCYNALGNYSKENEICEKALDAFDNALKHKQFRLKKSDFFDKLDKY